MYTVSTAANSFCITWPIRICRSNTRRKAAVTSHMPWPRAHSSMIAVLLSAVLVCRYAVLLRLSKECGSSVDLRLFYCALDGHGGWLRLNRGAFYHGLYSMIRGMCWGVSVVSAILGRGGRHVCLSQTGGVRGTMLHLARRGSGGQPLGVIWPGMTGRHGSCFSSRSLIGRPLPFNNAAVA